MESIGADLGQMRRTPLAASHVQALRDAGKTGTHPAGAIDARDRLDPRNASGEFFKLTLEHGLNLGSATLIRNNSVMPRAADNQPGVGCGGSAGSGAGGARRRTEKKWRTRRLPSTSRGGLEACDLLRRPNVNLKYGVFMRRY